MASNTKWLQGETTNKKALSLGSPLAGDVFPEVICSPWASDAQTDPRASPKKVSDPHEQTPNLRKHEP